MSYRGMMDGWHGDEFECHGYCGLCDLCDERYYQQGDETYESWHYEELVSSSLRSEDTLWIL
jgi:hypothetical protein